MIWQRTNGRTKARGSIKDIQEFAQRLNLPIKFERRNIIEGWTGKQKGMLQILWERRFIDPMLTREELVRKYSAN